jgi:hypothetical protein
MANAFEARKDVASRAAARIREFMVGFLGLVCVMPRYAAPPGQS